MTDWNGLEPDEHAALCASLLSKGASGNSSFQEAWEALYYRFRDLVFWKFRTSCYGLAKEDLEDMTQEVFFRLYRNLGSYRRDTGSFRGLLRAIVNSVRNDWFRAQRPELEQRTLVDNLRKLAGAASAQGPSADQILDAVTMRFRTMSTAMEQHVLQMLLEDASIHDVCTTLGLTEYKVKNVRQRAKDLLEEVAAELHIGN